MPRSCGFLSFSLNCIVPARAGAHIPASGREEFALLIFDPNDRGRFAETSTDLRPAGGAGIRRRAGAGRADNGAAGVVNRRVA